MDTFVELPFEDTLNNWSMTNQFSPEMLFEMLNQSMIEPTDDYTPMSTPNMGQMSARSSISEDNDDPMSEDKRERHIRNEKQRRAILKTGFDELKRLLPAHEARRVMSKVQVLDRTVAYIKALKTDLMHYQAELNTRRGSQ
jgi:hypothetical protein